MVVVPDAPQPRTSIAGDSPPRAGGGEGAAADDSAHALRSLGNRLSLNAHVESQERWPRTAWRSDREIDHPQIAGLAEGDA